MSDIDAEDRYEDTYSGSDPSKEEAESLLEKLRKGHEKQMASWGTTCKRCGAEEYRIKGFCSTYCEDMYEVEQERDQAIARTEKAEKEADEWHKMAEQFYKLLLNYAKFDTVDAGIVFGNYMLKYHNLAQCYSHAHPSETKGTEVKE